MQWATDLERDGHYLEQAYCFSEAQELRQRPSWTLGILIRMQHTSFISVIFVLLNRLLFWDKTSSVYLMSRFRDSAAKCHNQRQLNVTEHTLHPSCVCLSSFPCPTLGLRWTLSPWAVMREWGQPSVVSPPIIPLTKQINTTKTTGHLKKYQSIMTLCCAYFILSGFVKKEDVYWTLFNERNKNLFIWEVSWISSSNKYQEAFIR